MLCEVELLLKPTAEGVTIDRVAVEDYFSYNRGYDDSTNGIFCEDGSMILMCACHMNATSLYGMGWYLSKAITDAEHVQKGIRVFEARGKVVST